MMIRSNKFTLLGKFFYYVGALKKPEKLPGGKMDLYQSRLRILHPASLLLLIVAVIYSFIGYGFSGVKEIFEDFWGMFCIL